MKRKYFGILLLLSAALLLGCLSACDAIKEWLPNGSQDSEFANPFAEQPYYLIYTSNGDGTCYVSDILFAPDKAEDFTLVIPETSPDGDCVIGVRPEISQQNANYAIGLPVIMSASDFDALIAKMQENSIPDFDLNKFRAYYLRTEPKEGLTPAEKEELFGQYPLAEYAAIYVLDTNVSFADTQRLYGIIERYAGYSAEQRAANDLELLALCEQHLTEEQTLWMFRLAGCRNVTYLKGLSLPAGIEFVEMPIAELEGVRFAGTMEEWADVTYNLDCMNGLPVSCSDGMVQAIQKQPDYWLVYTENQWGTFVTGVYVNAAAQEVVIEIPEGAKFLTYTNGMPDTGTPRNLPHALTKEEYNALLQRLSADSTYQSTVQGAYEQRNDFLGITDHPFYFLKKTLTADELTALSQILEQYAGYTVAERADHDFAMIAAAEKSEDKYAKSVLLGGLGLEDTSRIVSLHIPVSMIEVSFPGEYEEITYAGTMEQWARVRKQISVKVVHCSDGDITAE